MNGSPDIHVICQVRLNFLKKGEAQLSNRVGWKRQCARKTGIHNAFNSKIGQTWQAENHINTCL